MSGLGKYETNCQWCASAYGTGYVISSMGTIVISSSIQSGAGFIPSSMFSIYTYSKDLLIFHTSFKCSYKI